MLYYLFIVSFSLAFVYVGFKRRTPDLLTVGVVCCGYYCSMLFVGDLYDPDTKLYVKIHDFLYIAHAFLFLTLLAACIINDFVLRSYYKVAPTKNWRNFNRFHLLLVVALFLLMNSIDSRSFFPSDVGEFSAASFGFIYNIYWASVLLLLIGAMQSKINYLRLIASVFVLSTLLAGSRAYFLAAAFIVCFLYFQGKPPIRLFGSATRVIVMIMGFFFLIIFKNVYQYLLFLDLQSIVRIAGDWDVIIIRLTTASEALVLLNFQHAITLYEETRGSFFSLVFLESIPFVSELFVEAANSDPRKLSDFIDQRYFQSTEYGMASSFWGLFYFVGGPLACILSISFYVCSLLLLNIRVRRVDLVGAHLLPGAIFLAFYASRKEIGAVLFPFYMCLFMYAVWRFCQMAFRKSRC